MMKDSLVSGGYQAIASGTALCSMRSWLSRQRSSSLLWERSYSTFQRQGKREVEMRTPVYSVEILTIGGTWE